MGQWRICSGRLGLPLWILKAICVRWKIENSQINVFLSHCIWYHFCLSFCIFLLKFLFFFPFFSFLWLSFLPSFFCFCFSTMFFVQRQRRPGRPCKYALDRLHFSYHIFYRSESIKEKQNANNFHFFTEGIVRQWMPPWQSMPIHDSKLHLWDRSVRKINLLLPVYFYITCHLPIFLPLVNN